MSPLIGINCDFAAGDGTAQAFLHEVYFRAVEEAGGLPVLIPSLADFNLIDDLLRQLHGIVLTGGNDPHPSRYGQEVGPVYNALHPAREEFDFAFARAALATEIPILAICYGAQLLNILLGGDIIQDIPTALPDSVCHKMSGGLNHDIRIAPESLSSDIWQRETISAFSSHHQAVGKLGKGLQATGWAPDDVVEIVETNTDHFQLAVQFHPERSEENVRLPLFRKFVDESSEYAKR
jgi:putative glutamine amidotransferase